MGAEGGPTTASDVPASSGSALPSDVSQPPSKRARVAREAKTVSDAAASSSSGNKAEKFYTVQQQPAGGKHIIICKGDRERNSYKIIQTFQGPHAWIMANAFKSELVRAGHNAKSKKK